MQASVQSDARRSDLKAQEAERKKENVKKKRGPKNYLRSIWVYLSRKPNRSSSKNSKPTT